MESESVMRLCTYVEKGGVGKTTSSAHIAVAAAQEHDLDVLLIDLAGTQNDLAANFGLTDEIAEIDAPISAVFGEDWEFIQKNIDDVFDRMTFETEEGPDLIPADPGLGKRNNDLANVSREERFTVLDEFIEDEVAPRYDLVLMDLPGNENNIVLNGLFAAQDTIAPLRPGEFERNQLANLETNLESIRDDEDHNVEPNLVMVIPTMVDATTNQSEQFVADIQAEYPERAAPSVASTANVGTEQSNGRTLFAADGDELYATGKRARDAYRELTADLIETLEAR